MAEPGDFKLLLDSKPELSERDDIVPFVRQRRHLSLAVGMISSNLSSLDRLAFEYDLFGDFTCARERQRINWRLDRVIINSNKAMCLTLDDLYSQLDNKLVRRQELAAGV